MPFDADAFLNQTVDAPMSTATVACPEGEYRATIDDGDKWIAFNEFEGKDGRPFHTVNILFNILDDNVRTQLKRDRVLVPFKAFLDVDSAGQLDLSDGRNVGIGRLRAALDQNVPGQAWSFAQLKGKGPLMVKVAQRSDKNDPSTKYAEIVRIAKIS